ncbi:MAG: hypothetical protein ACXWU2_06715 [Allosphingosinicella sp.]
MLQRVLGDAAVDHHRLVLGAAGGIDRLAEEAGVADGGDHREQGQSGERKPRQRIAEPPRDRLRIGRRRQVRGQQPHREPHRGDTARGADGDDLLVTSHGIALPHAE